MDTILDRYERVLERITRSAQSVGRKPETIRLVVVTKLQPVEAIEEAILAGVRYLGENYADEALQKKTILEEKRRNYQQTKNDTTMGSSIPFLYSDVQWHIIGHVQSRKARIVADSFDYLHSLDSLALSKRLDYFCSEKKRILPPVKPLI